MAEVVNKEGKKLAEVKDPEVVKDENVNAETETDEDLLTEEEEQAILKEARQIKKRKFKKAVAVGGAVVGGILALGIGGVWLYKQGKKANDKLDIALNSLEDFNNQNISDNDAAAIQKAKDEELKTEAELDTADK